MMNENKKQKTEEKLHSTEYYKICKIIGYVVFTILMLLVILRIFLG